MCIKVIIQIAIDKVLTITPRSHCPGFQSRRRYGVDTKGLPGPHRSGAGKHRSESGYTVLNRCLPGSGPGGFNFF